MVRCPKCNRMTAEINHYNGDVVCNSQDCMHVEKAKKCQCDNCTCKDK